MPGEYCITVGCGRRALSAVFKLCGRCWKTKEGIHIDRPPEPVYQPFLPVLNPRTNRKKIPDPGIPTLPGMVAEVNYDYRAIPDEGEPYDWHKARHLTWNEASQIIRSFLQANHGWTVIEVARRYNLRTEQVKKILNVDASFPNGRQFAATTYDKETGELIIEDFGHFTKRKYARDKGKHR